MGIIALFALFVFVVLVILSVLRVMGVLPGPSAQKGVWPMQNAEPHRSCGTCGMLLPSDAPEGLCPRCLFQQAIPSPMSTPPRMPAMQTSPHQGSFAAPGLTDLAPLFPQLELQELLGQGGMGAVYKARHAKLDRPVALKILPSETERDSAFADRFTREARALAKLNHPNIVAVHDFGDAGGQFYLIMEYVDGVNLRQLMQAGRVSANEALRIISQICDALQFAHDEGIVHRDIKPENILIDKRGRVKIADFGLAKILNRTPIEFTLTGTHQIMGTPHYMAPEQMERPQTVDHRADIYSLGVLFYEMLTGELPMGRFAIPSQKAGVDSRLDDIVLRALEKDPDRRYQRVSEVKSEVDSIAFGLPVSREHMIPAMSYQEELDQEMLRLQVKVPAVGLLLTAAAAVVFWAIMGFVFAGAERQWWAGQEHYFTYSNTGSLIQGMRDTRHHLVTDLFAASLIALALSGAVSFVVLGARSMMRLDRYEFAVFASIWVMIPWSGPGILVGLPFGIISLVLLNKPNIKSAFVRNALRARRKSLVPPTGRELEMLRLQSKGPAICLKLTALIGLVQWVILGVVGVIMEYEWLSHKVMTDTRKMPPEFVVPLLVGIPLLVSVWILFSAARRLSRFEDYGFVTLASIWAMLPWSIGFLVGLPVGIWTLLFLRRSDVRLAFLQADEKARLVDSEAISRAPVRGGMRSFFGGMGSLFLGSRTAANPLNRSTGLEQFPPMSAASHRPYENPQEIPSPQGLSPAISLDNAQSGMAKANPSQLSQNKGVAWAFVAPWVFGIVFVVAIAIVKMIQPSSSSNDPATPSPSTAKEATTKVNQ
jgi:tRNA A-37 threonylcarbamoyl transferase component Bud32